MADDPQDFGAAQPLVDVVKGAYKKANDWLSKVPTPGAKAPDSPAPPDDTHKRLLDEANKSFIHPTQTAAQKKSTPAPTGKIMTTKAGPRKKM